VFGIDARDIRATDNETSFASSPGVDTSARQRFLGGFGEALAQHGLWSAALSLRLDSVWNLDTRVIAQPPPAAAPTVQPNRSEFIASPRLGIARQIASAATIHASVFRAFRSPTMNELYRTGQVGQETTQANAQLQSERATGWEIGATYASPANLIALSGTYFWIEINRPSPPSSSPAPQPPSSTSAKTSARSSARVRSFTSTLPPRVPSRPRSATSTPTPLSPNSAASPPHSPR
jgi:outer membrane receptor protein involved in Fe transport